MTRRLWTLLAAVALLTGACRPVSPTVSPTAAPTEVRGPSELQLKWPALGEAVGESPVLQWDGFPGATHYQVSVLDSSSAIILKKDTTKTVLRVDPPLPKGTIYNWNVQAQDDNHAVLAELNSQFSVKAELVLVWPPAGEPVESTPVLQWQGVAGAVKYRVVIVNDPGDPAQPVVEQIVKETSYTVAPPLKAGNYGWTVQAQDANRVVLAELKSTFTVKARLEVLDPVDGGEVSATPTIRWGLYDDIIVYQVVVANSGVTPPEVVFDRIGKGTEMFVDTPLMPEIVYALTIRALDEDHKVLAEANSRFTVYASGPFASCADVHGVASAECQALVQFYEQTGGPGWAGGSNWLTTNTPCQWSGVTCTDGHVTDLSMFYQGLNGSVPAVLGDLSNLQVLALHHNQLTGPIPPELGRLSHLARLDLSSNQLNSSLPAELGQLTALEIVSLNDNQLSGELPAAWAGLAALHHLDLGNNALTGPIPAEWGQLQQLQTLHLGHNQLSGSIPDGIGQLQQLTTLDVSFNQLSGKVPEASLRLPVRALWGNQLEGTVDCGGDAPAAVEFRGVSFNCVSSLATSVWPDLMPAVAAGENVPFWQVQPEHVRFTLASAPGAAPHALMGMALSDQAQVLILPAEEYEALDRAIRLQVGDLLELLANRPTTIDGDLPMLPLNGDRQTIRAGVKYLNFEGGSGVRYLTQYTQGPSAINNQELFYTFQGLTNDRAYYVAAFFPVALPNLPATGQLSDEDFANLMADYQAYLADSAAMLDAQVPEAFTPDLAQIDRLIESLVVHAPAP